MTRTAKDEERGDSIGQSSIRTGDEAILGEVTVSTHTTTPPPRFTEPQLVAKLEELGIGRPSTYANIVTVNQDRGYVHKKGNALAPTWQGMKVAQLIEAKTPDFVSYDYTAGMESELDKVADGSLSKHDFLKDAWAGANGVDEKVNSLTENIDWNDVDEVTLIHLPSGYQVRVNSAGAWLEDPNSPVDAKGYRKGAKIDDDMLLDEESLNADACRELIDKALKSTGPRELGVIPDGPYKGWVLSVSDGRYGAYAKAVKLTRNGNPVKGVKPVNATLPQELLTDDDDKGLGGLTLEDVLPLFREVRLPRHFDSHWFVGVSAKGNKYVAWKKTAKSRPKFATLPDEIDPRTVTLDEAKAIWEAKYDKTKTKK